MKNKLPIFAAAFVIAVTAANASAQGSDKPLAGNELIGKARERLDSQTSLSAKVRQRIHLFGQDLSSSGSYMQLGEGPRRYLRMDMRMQLAGAQASLLQVCDGRFMWVRQEFPGNQTLGRVDLRQIQESLLAVGNEPQLDPVANYMVLGGLPKLLAALDDDFKFRNPTRAMIGDEPMLAIEGNWKPEQLAKLGVGQAEDIRSGSPVNWALIPDQVPDRVRLLIGANDLFPYKIEYLRRDSSGRAKPAPVNALSTIEFYEVQMSAELDPLQFIFKPGDAEVADHTPLYMQKLGLMPSGRVLR